jgi:hypothetical protein
MRGQAAFERLGQQVQRRHRQQQAGRKTDGEGQPLARQAEHHQSGREDAEEPAEHAGEDDLEEQRGLHELEGGGFRMLADE